jgi:glycosyltransferase involved in cell wall biosynthesis
MKERTNIAIIGLRGIPAKYGGTEVFVEELVTRLKDKFNFYVMHEDNKFYEDSYYGIQRVHAPAIESKSTSIPTINDLITTIYLCLKHQAKINLFYFLGPDSSPAAILPKLAKKNVLINPDGVEWKRLIKRSHFAPFYLLPFYLITMVYMYLMEFMSCKLANVVVADSHGIKKHLEQRHKPGKIVYIAYGARKLVTPAVSKEEETRILSSYRLDPKEYYLTVARIVAENNIHIEIEGFKKTNSEKKLVIVGNFNEKDHYSRFLFRLKGTDENIILLNPIYDKEVLGTLRKNCFAYIHAYEVGGTNPSLLEQMIFKRPILAYDVPFNEEVLEEGGIYFKDSDDLAMKMDMLERGEFDLRLIKKTLVKKIRRQYNWRKVIKEYERLFEEFGRGV